MKSSSFGLINARLALRLLMRMLFLECLHKRNTCIKFCEKIDFFPEGPYSKLLVSLKRELHRQQKKNVNLRSGVLVDIVCLFPNSYQVLRDVLECLKFYFHLI